jgi:predicted ester cyclase
MARAKPNPDAAPAPTPSPKVAEIEALVRRYYGLFNARRFEEAARMVDPQAVFIYPIGKEHLIGRAGYRELASRWVEGFPDGRVTITTVLVPDEHTAITEWIGEGTHQGTLELPGFPSLAATGRHARLPMREFVTIAEGRIVNSRLEFDPDEMLRRLGLKS